MIRQAERQSQCGECRICDAPSRKDRRTCDEQVVDIVAPKIRTGNTATRANAHAGGSNVVKYIASGSQAITPCQVGWPGEPDGPQSQPLELRRDRLGKSGQR